jgi:hypothetical protein
MIILYETGRFIKCSKKLLGDKERLGLFEHLKQNPKSGDVIPGSGGVRKLRWNRPGTGKRGGVRVIYYFIDERGFVALLTVYAKNEKENMSAKEIKEYRKFVEMIKAELDGGKNGR